MDEQQVKALVQELLKGAMDGLKTHLDSAVKAVVSDAISPLSERLETLESLGDDEGLDDLGDLEDDEEDDSPLAARLQALEAQLAEAKEREEQRELEAAEHRFNSSLSEVLDSVPGLLHKSVVRELLSSRLTGDLTEDDELGWLTPDGKKLSEVLHGFLETPEGQHFLPSNYQDGTGTTKTSEKQAPASNLTQEILAAFG